MSDWLLTTRTEVWQQEQADRDDPSSVSEQELLTFQQDLASLRKLSQFLKAALPRVFLHEATARLMAGASPARTQQLLDRNLRRRGNNGQAQKPHDRGMFCVHSSTHLDDTSHW